MQHMLREMRLIINLLLIILLAGCTTSHEKSDEDYTQVATGGPRSRIFYDDYEKVWKAAQISIAQYPLKAYDIDSGTIETEFIGSDNAWLPPHQQSIQNGVRYKINIRVLKEKKGGLDVINVVILKQVEKKTDFFSNYERLISDGLEEVSILYRIQRELTFE